MVIFISVEIETFYDTLNKMELSYYYGINYVNYEKFK